MLKTSTFYPFPATRRTVAIATAYLANAITAFADLQLTGNGIAHGFQITTFASSLPLSVTYQIGPTSLATTSDGKVLVADFAGNVYRFNDSDGQTPGSAINVNHQFAETGTTPTMAYLNGSVYMARDRQLLLLNNDGSVNSTLFGGATFTSGGLAANPSNGHLYSNSNISPGQNLVDIDIPNNTVSYHSAPGGAIWSASRDGSVIYNSHDPVVFAYNTSDFSTKWTSTEFAASTVVIPIGADTDNILGYDHSGNLYMFDYNTGAATLMASGGSTAGSPLLAADLTGNSVFVTQGDSVLRISFTEIPEVGLNSVRFASLLVIGLIWEYTRRRMKSARR